MASLEEADYLAQRIAVQRAVARGGDRHCDQIGRNVRQVEVEVKVEVDEAFLVLAGDVARRTGPARGACRSSEASQPVRADRIVCMIGDSMPAAPAASLAAKRLARIQRSATTTPRSALPPRVAVAALEPAAAASSSSSSPTKYSATDAATTPRSNQNHAFERSRRPHRSSSPRYACTRSITSSAKTSSTTAVTACTASCAARLPWLKWRARARVRALTLT